jgi:hypothetical protein
MSITIAMSIKEFSNMKNRLSIFKNQSKSKIEYFLLIIFQIVIAIDIAIVFTRE